MQQVPRIWGILNVTPDSFSDGGQYLDPEKALEHAMSLIKDGASVIDIGAQSTRPGATLISPEEEWKRLEKVLPPLSILAKRHNVLISIDSFTEQVVENSLPYVDILNDVSGASSMPILEMAAQSQKKLVLMHSTSVPSNPSKVLREEINVISYLQRWFLEKIEILNNIGISIKDIILDPGIGFGKTAVQSIRILKDIDYIGELNIPILIGHSRKSCLKAISSSLDTVYARDLQTVAISIALMDKVQYVRVHNVYLHNVCFQALQSFSGN